MPLASSAGDAAYWGLAIFLVLLGVGSLFALIKLGRMFDKVSSLVGGAERDALPVVVKTGGTVDRVNYQLDKLDTVTDSAVSMADSADTAVRAVYRLRDAARLVRAGGRGLRPHDDAHGHHRAQRAVRWTGLALHGRRCSRLRVVPQDAEHVRRDGRREGCGAPARARPRRGSPRGRANVPDERAADADTHADTHPEAGSLAAARAEAEAGPRAPPDELP